MDRLETGLRIAEIRIKHGESQEETAKAIDEKRENIRNWENGTRALKAETIIKLSRHFNVTSDFLLGLTEVQSTDTELKAVCDYTGLTEESINALYKIRHFGRGLYQLNAFLAEYGIYFSDELYEIAESTQIASCRLDRLEQEADNMCHPSSTLDEIWMLQKNIKSALYEFSETWRDSPHVCGVDDVLDALHELELNIQSSLVKRAEEIHNGEHQED